MYIRLFALKIGGSSKHTSKSKRFLLNNNSSSVKRALITVYNDISVSAITPLDPEIESHKHRLEF